MSVILDELFIRETDPGVCEIDHYTDLLDVVTSSVQHANVVLESQQWSRVAAIGSGGCTIWEPSDFTGDELPFDPDEVAVQVTYFWDRDASAWDLAWVATWPHEEGQ